MRVNIRQASATLLGLALLCLAASLPAAAAIDIVGNTSNSATGTALAKGNVYRVDTSTTLLQQEFRLNFTTSQTLIFSVYASPVEFGTFTQIQTNSVAVTGTGLDWYSSGPINVPLTVGNFYLTSVSWSGTLTYFFGTGDQQAVSFGAQVHGFATGTNPLGPTVVSTVNDQAIYNQRVTTGAGPAGVIPEPGTVALLATGLLPLAGAVVRKRRSLRA